VSHADLDYKGTSRGHPMPLRLVSGRESLIVGEGEQQGERQVQSSGVGKGNHNRTSRSESDAYKSCFLLNADFENFSSATSTSTSLRHSEYDGPEVLDSEDEHVSNLESYVETEVDSSLEQDFYELPQSRSSRLHRMVTIKVHL